MSYPVALLGMPFDAFSSHLRGAAEAPDVVRRMLRDGASSLFSESGYELSEENGFSDAGNVRCEQEAADFETYRQQVSALLGANHRVLTIGGDHSITFPALEAYAAQYPDLSILHFDAHPDLYHDFEDNPLSHASPFARIMEKKLAKRLVQVGIRAVTPHLREQAERFGVEMHEMHRPLPADALNFAGPVYVSLDLDALDPAYAPGVSHHEPGGLSVRSVLNLLQGLQAPVVGADVVELNPRRDYENVTARVAAKFIKELAALLAAS